MGKEEEEEEGEEVKYSIGKGMICEENKEEGKEEEEKDKWVWRGEEGQGEEWKGGKSRWYLRRKRRKWEEKKMK